MTCKKPVVDETIVKRSNPKATEYLTKMANKECGEEKKTMTTLKSLINLKLNDKQSHNVPKYWSMKINDRHKKKIEQVEE